MGQSKKHRSVALLLDDEHDMRDLLAALIEETESI